MDLDLNQTAAVTAKDPRILVTAGAGSGKTRVLIERIAWLIETQKVSSYEIAAFTFSRKAANEMKYRLAERLGKATVSKITIGTMHAVALQMIRRFGEQIGLDPKHVTIYSEWERKYLLKACATDIGIFKKSWKVPAATIEAMFQEYYTKGTTPLESHPGFKLFWRFQSVLTENRAKTYGDLQIAFLHLLPYLAENLHWRHVLVDEVQDLDELQWKLVEGICRYFKAKLFACGDLDQSLYAFRGAIPQYLIHNQDSFTIYDLENNYRSTRPIVEAANRLIANNMMRIDRKSIAAREMPDDAKQIQVMTDIDSGRIVGMLRDIGGDNTAVLGRNHFLLKKLSDLLTAEGIEHTYSGGKSSVMNSPEFHVFHAFLKLAVNPYDNFSFMTLHFENLLGLSQAEYADIRLSAAAMGVSPFRVYLDKHDNDLVRFFDEAWDSHGIDLHFAIHTVHRLLGVNDMYDATVEFIEMWRLSHAETADDENQVKTYLDWLATYDIQDDLEDDAECFGPVLATVHAAKGLEWNTVIVAGLNEGILPSSHAIKADHMDAMEEERRIFYVAMTRATDRLFLTSRPMDCNPESKAPHAPVSRFVGEAIA